MLRIYLRAVANHIFTHTVTMNLQVPLNLLEKKNTFTETMPNTEFMNRL